MEAKNEKLSAKLDSILYAGLSVPNRRIIREEVEMGKREILDVVSKHVAEILAPEPLDSGQMHRAKTDLIRKFEESI